VSGIVLDRIRKEFGGGVVAVDDLSLEVADGEFMVLVGPSGCGKTTTLRMVAGLEEVSGGRISIGGKDVTDLPPRKRDIAMVFQSYALYAHMSARDNIGFGLRMAGIPKADIRERVDRTAEILGITELLTRKPRQLSGGQRQRVAMGRAIVREPSAFLMDEPLSNLDAKLRVEMRGEITGLQRRIGTPTLYVTHDQTEAMTMGDRVAILREGILEQLGTPAELYEHPVNMFVAAFIGSPAMNLITGVCERVDGRSYVRIGDSRLTVPETGATRWSSLDRFVGREIVIGIRPEDFRGHGGGTSDSIEAVVSRAELLGAELFIYFHLPSAPAAPAPLAPAVPPADEAPVAARATMTARLDRSVEIQAGTATRVAVDCDRLYLFDPVSGEALR
jgi:multiple sugar transport system ATP-binding protein